MMTQEAAYQQIQDAKSMVEDDLTHKLEEFEEEREHLLKLANTASALERELEQVSNVHRPLGPSMTHKFFREIGRASCRERV